MVMDGMLNIVEYASNCQILQTILEFIHFEEQVNFPFSPQVAMNSFYFMYDVHV